ncbi:MAG: glycoside hydrolase family 13 protein [Sporichthyaceae bacterium]|nr:glycoside hydrolase family 13 protein [Sporichthyaceae bacterium]
MTLTFPGETPTLRRAVPATTPWWRDAVVYQVYLRSFADADGDGIGDLAGLRARLDYIAALGVDAIWLNPCYPSPQADHGYDIADYLDIDPAYGDLSTFEALQKEARDRGLRVLMDLVPNHCSIAHPWFVAALAAGPGSPERAKFHFVGGRGWRGNRPPNNWRSVFGGPAWTRVTEPDGKPGQWYLHLFDSTQPDFNWQHPEVADYFDEVLRFWFDRGVEGFRIDVAHGMAKHPTLANWRHPRKYNAHMFNRPEVHAVHRRWRALVDSYRPARELTLVGEIWVPAVAELARYLRPDELRQAFFFDLLTQPWNAAKMRSAIQSGLDNIASTGATVTWVLSNHDVHRTVTRYGQEQPTKTPDPSALIEVTRNRGPVDVQLGTARAGAGILLLLALPGSVYLYQGEELGLPEVLDLPDEVRQDPIWRRSTGTKHGRDGCRVPLPWAAAEPTFGFSLNHAAGGAPAEPWLPQPDWFAGCAVDVQQERPDSMLALYRQALACRRELWAGDAELTWDDRLDRADLLVLTRGSARAVVAFGPDPVELPAELGEIVLASVPMTGRTLPGNAAAWLRS